jgi:hypothetical protein
VALSALLSQALVAFTIEFDNEFEHRMPHRTTNHGGTAGPWLVSMAMWMNCMQFIGEEGVPVRRLEELARTPTNLNGMVRWGYISIGADKVIRATRNGRRAQQVWRPLCGVIEQRWRARFGNERIDTLRESLEAISDRIDADLPDYLPILGYGLFSRVPKLPRRVQARTGLALPTLLSRVLLAFAMEYERESDWSLAVGANLLRVLDAEGVRVRDLPRLSGVSKEAIAMALGLLKKGGVVAGTRLTAKGMEARSRHFRRLEDIEHRWAVGSLREALRLSLFDGLEPYPDGWRASVPRPVTLPHYPMVLHRGGFPDGS